VDFGGTARNDLQRAALGNGLLVVDAVLVADNTCWPGSGSAQMRNPSSSQFPLYGSPSTPIRLTLAAGTPGPPSGTASSTHASPSPPVIA
jgi:hypothetical protein